MTDYTPILNLPQVAPGQNQKETTINTALAILEAAQNDTSLLSAAGGSLVLSTDQFTKAFLLQIGGQSGDAAVTVPATPRWFAVENVSSVGTLTVTCAPTGMTTGTPITVAPGKIVLAVSDGGDIRTVVPSPAGGSGILEDLSNVKSGATDAQLLRYSATDSLWEPWTLPALVETFPELTDVPQSYTGMGGQLLAVKKTEDGLEYISSSANIHLFDQLDDVPNSYKGSGGYLLRIKSTEDGVEFAQPKLADFGDVPDYSQSAGLFVRIAENGTGLAYEHANVEDLLDGPGQPNTSKAMQYVRVKQDGSGLEYALGTSGPDKLVELTDGPESYSGAAGAVVRVNPAASGFIFGKLNLDELGDLPSYPTAAGTYFVKSTITSGGVVNTFATPKVADLGDGPGLPAGKPLQLVRVSANATALEYHLFAFTDLAGVPSSYLGAAGKFIQVKPDGSGLQFATSGYTTSFTSLTDAPSSYSGKTGFLVQVNPTGTGLQFVNPTSVGVTTLAALTDVDETTAPVDGQALVYSNSEKKWKPVSIQTGFFPLESLTDVLITTAPDDGMSLVWSAVDAKWEARSIVAPSGSQAGKHSYWRILVLANQGGQQASFAEIQFRDPTGANLSTVGADATASSTYNGTSSASNAFDGSVSTSWRSTAADFSAGTAEIGYNFPTAVAIQSVQLTASGYAGESPSHFQVQYSDDGQSWTTALDRSVANWAAGTTNIYLVQAYQVTGFTQLTDAPQNYTNAAGLGVRVNLAGTGLEFFNAASAIQVLSAGSSLTPAATSFNFAGTGVQTTNSGGAVTITIATPSIEALSDVDATNAPSDGQALIYDGTEKKWKAGTPNGSGASRFTQLNDAPQNYTGAAGEVVRVNTGMTALEFHKLAVADLSDGPGAPATASALKAVRVKADGTALEYYVPAAVPTTLGALSDVTDSDTASDGFVLTFHNNKWQALAPVAGSGSGVSGVTPNFGAHIYWRALFLAEADATGTSFDIAEVQFRTSKGGASAAVNGTALSSYAAPGYGAGNAFDGSATTYASNQGQSAQFDLAYQFTAAVNIVEVAIESAGSGVHTPKNFAIHYSDDGQTWTAAFAVVGETNWGKSELRVYSPAARVTQFRDLNDVPNAYPNDGSILAAKTDGSGLGYVAAPPRSFVQLLDAPTSYAGKGLYYVRVKTDGSGLEFAVFPQSYDTLGGLNDVDESTTPVDGQVLRYKASESKWAPSADAPFLVTKDNGSSLNSSTKSINFVGGSAQVSDDGTGNVTVTISASDSGATVFTALSDVPNSYNGQALKTVRVNAAANGLEFWSPPTTLAGQSDVAITAPVDFDFLIYRSGKWINVDPRTAILEDPYGTHAYWRIRPTGSTYTSASYVNISELAFRGVSGGPSQCFGGTPLGTTSNGGDPPSAAFDGNVSTSWFDSGASTGQNYVGYQFPEPVRVAEVAITSDGTFCPSGFIVEYSDDANVWTTAWTEAGLMGWSATEAFASPTGGMSLHLSDFPDGPGATTGQAGKTLQVRSDSSGYQFVFATLANDKDVLINAPVGGQTLIYNADAELWENVSLPTLTSTPENFGAHAYWRVHYDAVSQNGAAGLAEVVFSAAPGGVQQASGGTALSSSVYSGSNPSFVAANAFDANTATLWASSGNSNGEWIGYEFTSKARVQEVSLTARADSFYTEAPSAFSVQWSDDGVNWSTAWSLTGVTWTSEGQLQTFDAPSTPSFQIELEQLSDVSITATPTDGQALVYSAQANKWVPGSVSAGSGSGSNTPTTPTAPIFPDLYEPPALASFPTVISGGASTVTATDTGIGMLLTASQVSSTSINAYLQELPSGGIWTATARLKWSMNFSQYPNSGIYLTDAGKTKLLFFGPEYRGGAFVSCKWYQSPTTYQSDNANLGPVSGYEYYRVHSDGSNIYYLISQDGVSWAVLHSEAYTAYLSAGPTLIGIGIDPETNGVQAGGVDSVNCLYWDVESSASFAWKGPNTRVANGAGITTAAAGASTLAGLTDVDESVAPTDGQALVYSASEGKWKPGTVASVGSSSSSGNPTFYGSGAPTASASAHVYWRIDNFSDTDGNYISIAELAMADTKGGPDLCTGGTPIESGHCFNYVASQAFDNNTQTIWAQTPLAGAWLGYQFPQPTFVAELTITPRQDNSTNVNIAQSPTAFALSYSDDGVNWTRAQAFTPASWSALTPQTFEQTGYADSSSFVENSIYFDTSASPYGEYVYHTATWHKIGAASGSGGATALSGLSDIDETTAPTDGQVLTYSASESKWKPHTPTASGSSGSSGAGTPLITTILHKTSAQTLTSDGSWSVAVWDKVVHDELSAYNSANPGRITIPSGVTRARFTGYTSWPNAGSGPRYMALVKNGSDQGADCVQAGINAHTNESDFGLVSQWLDVAAGDYFQLMVADASDGVALQGDENVGVFGAGSYFQAEFAANLNGVLAPSSGGLTSDTYWNMLDSGGIFSTDETGRSLVSGNYTNNWMSIRGSKSQSSGKVYYEIKVVLEAAHDPMPGVGTAQAGLGNYIGADAFGWGQINTGALFNNGGSSISASAFANGDIIGVGVDFTAGTITFYKNGATNGQFTGLALSTPLFPMLGAQNQSSSVARFNAADMTYLPSGYTAWGVPVSASAATLSALSDIDETTPPTDGQVLTYSGSESKWKPATAAAGGGGGASGSYKDAWVLAGSYVYGDTVTYNGQLWQCLSGSTTTAPGADNSWGRLGLDRSYDYWNDQDMAPGIAFIASDGRTIDGKSTQGWKHIRGIQTRTSGKLYWEISVLQKYGNDGFIGVTAPGTPLNTYPAQSSGFGRGFDGNQLSNWGGSTSSGSAWTAGDVIGFALDFSTGNLTMYHNNASDGGVTGMTIPTAGCNLAAGFEADNQLRVKLCTTATACKYAPPTAFSYWT